MKETFSVDPIFMEQCMIISMMKDKQYLATIANVFEPEYFDSYEAAELFRFTVDHFKKFKELPSETIAINSMDEKTKENVKLYLDETKNIEFSVQKSYDWLITNTDLYLKDKAIKLAFNQGVDVINKGEDIQQIRKLVETALCKTININLGLDYFGMMSERLRRMFTDDTQRIPTYFPTLDGFINGGLPPKTLSILIAKIHGFKSNTMANIIARQVMHGKNVFLASLEMSEDMFAQRFDGIYSKLDINSIYYDQGQKQKLVSTLKDLKNQEGRGNLYIKAFPTGKASVTEFRSWLREMSMRGVEADIFYFDYLNLMSSESYKKDDSYGKVKAISEEARAMGFEFNIPMVSVSQLNRAGTFMSFEEVDFNSIGESLGPAATADFMAIMGRDEDSMIYNNEVAYKIVKNRLGGRVGSMDKLYFDARSLKMYDSCEIDLWMDDVRYSSDVRNTFVRSE